MPAIATDQISSLNYSLLNIGQQNLASFNLPALPSLNQPSVREILGANEPQKLYQDAKNSIDLFDDNDYLTNFISNDDNDLFGSPMAFDASENGLWNGRFVPPPPRPPFMDELITDGVTTCDLCSWAMPTKSTFIFDGTIGTEKATELGWPLTLIIVSIISAILGAIVMVTVVRCKRKKSSNRNETHVQWWSRNKRTNNHLRRSNIYTAHPADSIRGLQTNTTVDTCNWPNVTTIVVTS